MTFSPIDCHGRPFNYFIHDSRYDLDVTTRNAFDISPENTVSECILSNFQKEFLNIRFQIYSVGG